MRLSLTVFPLLACLGVRASAADGTFTPSGRAGLFHLPGHVPGEDSLHSMSGPGWICGYSKIGGAPAAWVTNPADGLSRRVGLHAGAGFETNPSTWFFAMTPEGLVCGSSRSVDSGGRSFEVTWTADGATGATRRVGLTGLEFPEGRESSFKGLTRSGYAQGVTSGTRGRAPWVANLRTGAVFRAGLYEGDPIYSNLIGEQDHLAHTLTESGWLGGRTVIYGQASPWRVGFAVWVTSAATGVTRRMGLFHAGEYSPGPGGEQSFIWKVMENGLVAGTSERWRGGVAYAGTDAWVQDAATGALRRVGLVEGREFTHPATGMRKSGFAYGTPNGWLMGASDIMTNGANRGGRAIWVAEAATGVTRRVGLWEEEEFRHPVIGGYSDPSHMSEEGWALGASTRYVRRSDGSYVSNGTAPWVADGRTGVTRRMGLTGPAFTGASGEQTHYASLPSPEGWVTGTSRDYRVGDAEEGTTGESRAAWVTNFFTGETKLLGLTGGEFTSSAGVYERTASGRIWEGKVTGYSTRYHGAEPAGRAAWVTDLATGAVTRLGLYSDAPGYQDSTLEGWTGSGYAHGHSTYGAAEHVPWVADLRTGETRMAGLPGVVGVTRHLTEDGIAGGGSNRPGGNGSTAWVLDMKTGRRATFDLSVRASTGYSYSQMDGYTEDGVWWGTYTLFDGAADLGPRFFLWARGLGTLLVEGVRPWRPDPQWSQYLIMRATAGGMVAIPGAWEGIPGQSVFFGKLPAALSPAGGARVTDLARLPDGKFRLSFHSDAAMRITLQSSADLSTWRDAQTIDAPAGASHMDLEPDPGAGSSHYWRLKTSAPAAAP